MAVSDTQTTAGNVIVRPPKSVQKVFSPSKASHLVFGVAGDVSVSTALRAINIPSCPKNLAGNPSKAYDYMASVVIPSMKAHILPQFPENSPFTFSPGFQCLVWIRDTEHVFEISSDFSMIQDESGFYSIGSGSYFARSSFDLRPDAPILDHMKYAASRDLYTSGPFAVLEGDK